MKRGKKLIALCAALVVLGLGYGLARTLNAETEEEDAGIPVAALDSETVTALSWTGEEEGEVALTRTDESWALAADDTFPLDQTTVEPLLAALTDVTASQQLDSPESLTAYGLDDPELTITAETEEGSYTFTLGDENDLAGGCYLLLNGDESVVYLVDTGLRDAFTVGLYDLVDMEDLPDFDRVTGVTVAQTGGSLELTYVEDSSELSWYDGFHWFLDDNGVSRPLDGNSVTDLYTKVTTLSWLSCVNYRADDTQREEYGLTKNGVPTAAVTLTYEVTETADTGETDADSNAVTEEQTTVNIFTLWLGSDTDEGTYAMVAGSDMVYLIDTETADALRYASYASLRPSGVCTLDWDTVDAIDVTMDGVTRTIQITREEVEVTDDDGETTSETVTTYTWDGAGLDGDLMGEVATILSGLTATGEAGSTGGEELVTLTFHRTADAYAEVTLTLSYYDASSCLAAFTDTGPRLVDRSSVTDLTSQLDALFQSAD